MNAKAMARRRLKTVTNHYQILGSPQFSATLASSLCNIPRFPFVIAFHSEFLC